MPRIRTLKGSAIDALWPTPDDVDMTADLETLIRREVDRWHGDGGGGILYPPADSDDIPTMVRHDHYGAALWLLMGATELPLWGAISDALWFNGRQAEAAEAITADFEAWCALELPHSQCPECNTTLWEVDPDDFTCHSCLHRHVTPVDHAHSCRDCDETIEHTTTDDVCGFNGLCADCEWIAAH